MGKDCLVDCIVEPAGTVGKTATVLNDIQPKDTEIPSMDQDQDTDRDQTPGPPSVLPSAPPPPPEVHTLAELPGSLHVAIAAQLPTLDVATASTVCRAFTNLPYSSMTFLDACEHALPEKRLTEFLNLNKLVSPSLALVSDLSRVRLPCLTDLCIILSNTPSRADVELLNSISSVQGPLCKLSLQLPCHFNLGALETVRLPNLVQVDMRDTATTKKQLPQLLKELALVVSKVQPEECQYGVLGVPIRWSKICKYMEEQILPLNKLQFEYGVVDGPAPDWLCRLEQADISIPASLPTCTFLPLLINVKQLTLRAAQLTLAQAEAAGALASMQSLHSVEILTSAGACPATWDALTAATQLRCLSWKGPCTPSQLAGLAALTQLTSLRLNTCGSSCSFAQPHDQAFLQPLCQLEQLDWTGVSSLQLSTLPASLQLCCLELTATAAAASLPPSSCSPSEVSSSMSAHIHLPRLKVLKMAYCPGQSSEAILQQLALGSPLLSVLDVSHWALTASGLAHLSSMKVRPGGGMPAINDTYSQLLLKCACT